MSEQRHRQNRATRRPTRPDLPASYRVPVDSNGLGEAAWSRASEMLASARNYWIATTRPDRRPHAMPVWGVWLDEMFWFATDRGSRKGRNLASNSALVVHLESGDDVVILEGLAEDATASPLLPRVVDAYEKKYKWRLDASSPEQVIHRVRPRVAFTWLERSFPETATRWLFSDA